MKFKKFDSIKWMHPGTPPIAHAFPQGPMFSFTALCGERFGGLNGVYKQPRCEECERLAEGYEQRVEAERVRKLKRWCASKLRKKLVARITKAIDMMDRFGLEEIVNTIKGLS